MSYTNFLAFYHAYIASPKWRDIRSLVLTRDCETCQSCNSHECLEVHHIHYKLLAREELDLSCLITLCRYCHEEEHRQQKKLRQLAFEYILKKKEAA